MFFRNKIHLQVYSVVIIDVQGKHKIHISFCGGFSLKTLWYICIFTITSWYWNGKMYHCVARPSASMILTVGDKQVLVLNEESINNKDARSHSNRIRSNGIILGVLTCNIRISIYHGSWPHQATSTHGIDYSQYHGCWWPGNASKVSTTCDCLSYIYVGSTHLCSWDFSHEAQGSCYPSWSISCVLMAWRPNESRNVETRIFKET